MPTSATLAEVPGLTEALLDVAFRFTERKTHETRRIALAEVLRFPGALASLVTGRPHSTAAGWIEARKIIAAEASHGHGAIGGMLPNRDLTHVTAGAKFVATLPGHLPDGEVWFSETEAVAYRLRLVGQAKAA